MHASLGSRLAGQALQTAHSATYCMLVLFIQCQSVSYFIKSVFISDQIALTLLRSPNLFCFLWAGKS